MERTSWCAACLWLEVGEPELAVDPACRSTDEADRLCRIHRARMTEGYCVACARREPWVSPFPDSSIGFCRACTAGCIGEPAAIRLEEELASILTEIKRG